MSDTVITLHISAENRAYIDKLRGDRDITEFLENEITARLAQRAVAERLNTAVSDGIGIGDEDLSPEMLTRLADEGEATAMDFAEFKRTLYQRIKQRRAKRDISGANQ